MYDLTIVVSERGMGLKKGYETPSLHRVELILSPDIDLASVSEEVALDFLKQASYFENKVSYIRNEDFITRDIAGEKVLVPTGKQAISFNGMITFSETGAFLWEHLCKKRTKADLIYLMISEYNLDVKTASTDLGEFLDKAIERHLIIRCEENKGGD